MGVVEGWVGLDGREVDVNVDVDCDGIWWCVMLSVVFVVGLE